MEDLLDFQISEASKTSAKAEPKSLQFIPIWDHLFPIVSSTTRSSTRQVALRPSATSVAEDLCFGEEVLRGLSPKKLERNDHKSG